MDWPKDAVEAAQWWSSGKWSKSQFDRYLTLIPQGKSRALMEGTTDPLYGKRPKPREYTWFDNLMCLVYVVIIFIASALLMVWLDINPGIN